MKSWPAVVSLLCVILLGAAVRRSLRVRLVAHLVSRSGTSRASGSRAAVLVLGTMTLGALGLLALGLWARAGDEPIAAARFVVAAIVVGLYVPLATLGAPRLTRWQKTLEDRLVLAGATREAAGGVASVAGPISVLAVLVALACVALVL